MIEPLRLAFDVACPSEHAFDVWTSKIARWWPADNSVSGGSGLLVVLHNLGSWTTLFPYYIEAAAGIRDR